MNFNYQKARDLMVENQLRPNKIKELNILNLFRNIEKEKFIPNELKNLSYSDMDINIREKRGYLKNLHIAQLIKYADLNKNHKVLHIGALTGYVSTILANLCNQVYALESDLDLRNIFEINIQDQKINNIKIIDSDFKDGYELMAPYDRIFIDTPISKIDKIIMDQINPNLGKIIMIKKININLSQAIIITNNNNNISQEYLFDVFSSCELYKEEKGFEF